MSDTEATVANEAPETTTKKKIRHSKPSFSMEFWEDERQARKHIKENFQLIQQRAKSEGIPVHFSRTKKSNEDGMQTIEVQYGSERKIQKKDGTVETQIVFTGRDYIRLTYDPNRKLPKREGAEENEEGQNSGKRSNKNVQKFKSRA